MSTLTVFDLDDTLAMTERHITAPFTRALFQLVREELKDPDFETFERHLLEQYRLYGSGIHTMMAELEKDVTWGLSCFASVAKDILPTMQANVIADTILPDRLRLLQKQGHTLAILTLGHRDYALPALKHLGLSEIFPEEMVFDISRVGGHLKRTEHPYRHVLNELSDKLFLHHNMVEDSPANLGPAKKLGFTTWLVGEKMPSEELVPLIDHRHADIHCVLDAMLAA